MPLDSTPPAPSVCRCDACPREYTLAALRALRTAPTPADVAACFGATARFDSRRCECGATVGIVLDAEDALWAPCPCCDGTGDSTIPARVGTYPCGRCSGRGSVTRETHGECSCGRTAPVGELRRIGSRSTKCVPDRAVVAWPLYECPSCTASIGAHVAQWGAE